MHCEYTCIIRTSERGTVRQKERKRDRKKERARVSKHFVVIRLLSTCFVAMRQASANPSDTDDVAEGIRGSPEESKDE